MCYSSARDGQVQFNAIFQRARDDHTTTTTTTMTMAFRVFLIVCSTLSVFFVSVNSSEYTRLLTVCLEFTERTKSDEKIRRVHHRGLYLTVQFLGYRGQYRISAPNQSFTIFIYQYVLQNPSTIIFALIDISAVLIIFFIISFLFSFILISLQCLYDVNYKRKKKRN